MIILFIKVLVFIGTQPPCLNPPLFTLFCGRGSILVIGTQPTCSQAFPIFGFVGMRAHVGYSGSFERKLYWIIYRYDDFSESVTSHPFVNGMPVLLHNLILKVCGTASFSHHAFGCLQTCFFIQICASCREQVLPKEQA